ncbi:MAG: RDD family protein [Sphingobacteriaceae bacterium]|nr:MAG: RDD family protein [Sphingobacteriaceae bacterium]
MQTVTIQTTQNIGIDYEVAGLGERILARLIDYGVFIVFMILAVFGISSFSVEGNFMQLYIFSLFGLFVFSDLLCELFFNGQSLGKRIMKIRVISLDGGRPGFGQYLMRWLFRLVDFGITGNLGGLLCAALTKNVQRIGDVVAGTTLIKTQPRTQMEHLIFKPAEDNYEPVFKQATQLTDNDIALVNEVIHNYYKTGNNTVVYNMTEKLKQHLGITLPENMNDMQFLQIIIKDYSHITALTSLPINN